ncbi:hypothetical protein [Sphingomonas sp. GC_Shp_3]|uniref:phage tail assembly chaperone n=1 Tax=Sphingomonas sp. GC_Shp_3 TaxID=2937383 RepID=UPI00226A12D9|nr:hypothetical protein [Sphingomonas sp. GC_Shp_3]
MAWLNAVPKPPDGSKRAQRGEADKISRGDRLKKDGLPRPMPPNPLSVVIERLVEIGLFEVAGMGAAPLSWATLEAWQRVSSVELSPWECRLIRHLSVEYLAEGRRAEAETCPPPWRAEVTQRERDIAEARLRLVLG